MSRTQIHYLLREGFLGITRRRLSGGVAILIMGSSLLTLALFSLVTINLDKILQTVRGEIDVVVYLDDLVHPDDQGRLHGDLASMAGVVRVQYVSREQALSRFRTELGEDAELLDALDENPLPASFEVVLSPEFSDSERIDSMSNSLREYPGVVDVLAQIDWVERLDRFTRIFGLVTAVIGLIVLISSLFVISNTVRLTVEERADQVEVMKLVGATNRFIRTPFVISGAMQGFTSGVLAMIVLAFAHKIVAPQIEGLFFFDSSQMAGFVALSMILGSTGSMVALRRHLRL